MAKLPSNTKQILDLQNTVRPQIQDLAYYTDLGCAVQAPGLLRAGASASSHIVHATPCQPLTSPRLEHPSPHPLSGGGPAQPSCQGSGFSMMY